MENYFYNLLYKNETDHWWYWVRRKFVHKLINLYRPTLGPMAILDIGCGTGKLNEELRQYGDVAGIDISKEAVKFCSQRGLNNVRQSSIEEYQPPLQQFDCVIALDVLEHCQDDQKIIEKIYRLLKNNGVAIVFVPALKCFWGKTDIISHHYRRYANKELRDKVNGAGFIILNQSYFNFFLAMPIFLIRKITNLMKSDIESEFQFNNRLTNKICKFIFNLEIYFLPKIKFPFGVSLMGVYKKQ